MRMRNGGCGHRGVREAGLVALLLVSATAVNGQWLSVSDFERFQFYNACRPMGLRSHSGGSIDAGADAGTLEHEDGRPGMNLDPIVDVAKSRLRAERLYSLLESESNGAALVVSVDVRAVSRELVAYAIGLEYHKLVTDATSGLEKLTATWRNNSIVCCDPLDPESISEHLARGHLDFFLEKYRQVNEEDCRPPSLTATGRLSCTGQWSGTECWMELSNVPGCYVWSAARLPEQTVTWTGECGGELAQGQGTLKWAWDRGRGEETAEETGHLRAGKKWRGQWIRRYGNGTVHEGEVVEGKRHGRWVIRRADGAVVEGSYVEGKRHGQWVTRHKSGKREVVTYKHGWQGKSTKIPDEDPKEVEVDENTPRDVDGDR